ncbi:MAG: hypothetical protein KKC77_02385 [Proteobacteria bacterium]|nr:hypothetical protein [Pseudomonadota bacterium]MBU1231707.1 hypothetical protein [Pseudomonadota bacterium]
MANRLSIIGFFVLATLLAAGSVEFFYRSLDQALIVENQPSAMVSSEPARTNTATAPSPAKPSRQATNGKDYSIIAKRSLFGKIKKEESKVAPAPTPVLEATSLDLTLLGTISGGSNDQRAIIQDKRKKTQDIYYQGDAVGPALIKEILRGQVILTVRGKDEILLMKEPKSPPSAGRIALPPPSVNDYVAEEPEPIEEEIIESEPPPEEVDSEQNELVPGDEVEGRPGEQDQRPGPSSIPRKVSFKKKNNQVAEP